MQHAAASPSQASTAFSSLCRVVDAHSFVEQFMRNNRLFNCGTAIEMQALNLRAGSTVRRVKMKGLLVRRKRR